MKKRAQKRARKIKRADVRKDGQDWLYSKIVKDHFFHPRNVLIGDEKSYKFDAKGTSGNPICLVSSTLIQKNPEMGMLGAINLNDRVLSHDGYFHTVSQIFQSQDKYDQPLIYLKNQLGELICTPDHLIFAVQLARNKKYPFIRTKDKKRVIPSWVHAGNLKPGDIVLYPIPKENKPFKKIDLPLFARKKHDFKSRALPQSIPLTEELMELFGYYVAEGHTKKSGLEVGFCFGSREMNYAKRVQYLVKKYFGLPTTLKEISQGNRIYVAVHNIYLVELFQNWFGRGAAKKHIPEFMFFAEPHIQRGFIRGVWRGGGYFSPMRLQPRAGFTTISEKFIHQLKWLLLRQNIAPAIYREKAHTRDGVFHRPSYRIHVGDMSSLEKLAKILKIKFIRNPQKRHPVETWFDSQYLYLPLQKVSAAQIDDNNQLLNLEVEESHSYTTDAFLVHNCGDVMTVWLKIDPKTSKIKDCKWRAYGCASAIATTSMMSVMVTEKGGMTARKALNLKPQQIIDRLGGLPALKFHCSVLGLDALKEAINGYFRSQEKN